MGSPLDPCPVACIPGAIPAHEREAHFARAGRLFHEVALEREVMPAGYRFRFPPGELEELSRFVAHERRCCPFLSFSIEVGPEGAALDFRITGPPGGRAVVEAELLTRRRS